MKEIIIAMVAVISFTACEKEVTNTSPTIPDWMLPTYVDSAMGKYYGVWGNTPDTIVLTKASIFNHILRDNALKLARVKVTSNQLLGNAYTNIPQPIRFALPLNKTMVGETNGGYNVGVGDRSNGFLDYGSYTFKNGVIISESTTNDTWTIVEIDFNYNPPKIKIQVSVNGVWKHFESR